MEDPEEFLGEFVLDEVGELYKRDTSVDVSVGVHKFDLVPGFKKVAELHLADAIKDPKEELITAYWLPWKTKAITEIELGDEAEYFFTNFLGGCQLRILPAGKTEKKVKVLHIAGDGKISDDSEGKKWRAQEVEKVLNKAELGRSRSFSSTDPILSGGYAEAGEVTVVGFKDTSGWEFWAQERTEGGEVESVWKIMKAWKKSG
ncbi:MAG TPA: hypothetical protein VIT23_10705 [Terrimicrobiaceae bacterium]